jgi:hypothetical protein
VENYIAHQTVKRPSYFLLIQEFLLVRSRFFFCFLTHNHNSSIFHGKNISEIKIYTFKYNKLNLIFIIFSNDILTVQKTWWCLTTGAQWDYLIFNISSFLDRSQFTVFIYSNNHLTKI